MDLLSAPSIMGRQKNGKQNACYKAVGDGTERNGIRLSGADGKFWFSEFSFWRTCWANGRQRMDVQKWQPYESPEERGPGVYVENIEYVSNQLQANFSI